MKWVMDAFTHSRRFSFEILPILVSKHVFQTLGTQGKYHPHVMMSNKYLQTKFKKKKKTSKYTCKLTFLKKKKKG